MLKPTNKGERHPLRPFRNTCLWYDRMDTAVSHLVLLALSLPVIDDAGLQAVTDGAHARAVR